MGKPEQFIVYTWEFVIYFRHFDIFIVFEQLSDFFRVGCFLVEIKLLWHILFHFDSKPLANQDCCWLDSRNTLYLNSGKRYSPRLIIWARSLTSPSHCSFSHLCWILTATFSPVPFNRASCTCAIHAELIGSQLNSILVRICLIYLSPFHCNHWNTWKDLFDFLVSGRFEHIDQILSAACGATLKQLTKRFSILNWC